MRKFHIGDLYSHSRNDDNVKEWICLFVYDWCEHVFVYVCIAILLSNVPFFHCHQENHGIETKASLHKLT